MGIQHTLQLVSVRWWNASAYYGISLAEALNQAGIRTTAGGRVESPPIKKASDLNIPILNGLNLETFSPIQTLQNLRRIRRFIFNQNVSLINAHRPEDGLFAALSRSVNGRRIPIVRTVSDVRPPKDHKLNHWLHESGFDFLIFSCQANYERYQSTWPIFSGKSRVIYSAVDTEAYKPSDSPSSLRKKLGFDDEDQVIGIIARLSPVKDHHTFLKAAARVVSKNDRARFLISGQEAQLSHDTLASYAETLGIRERVVFMPRDFNIDAREIIDAIDVGVVASNGSEVICRVSVEYMAKGKPQVVTDTNVLPEIVRHGQSGFVVKAGDDEAMAAYLLKVIEDPKLYAAMSTQARRHAVQYFSYPVFVKQTRAVYEEVLTRLS